MQALVTKTFIAMKKAIICLIIIGSMIACKKEDKICENPPEGIYEGWFTNTGSDETTHQPLLYLNIVDDTTFEIHRTPPPHNPIAYSVIRTGCNLNGKIGAGLGYNNVMDIDGVLSNEADLATIRGNYTYIDRSGGLGNPNPQWFEVTGTFIIKQQK